MSQLFHNKYLYKIYHKTLGELFSVTVQLSSNELHNEGHTQSHSLQKFF